MEFLKTLYIAATIFGVGVIFIDLIGSVSSASDADGDADGDGAHDDGGHDSDHAGDDSADHDINGGHHEDGDESAHEHGSMVLHNKSRTMSLVLKTLGTLRTFVYFSFGFGAVGWFALATGRGVFSSLIWSIPVGVVIAAIAKIVKRIQNNELDSTFKDSELLMEKGIVTVSINKGEMGRVRLIVRGATLERFARATTNNVEIKKGSLVNVVDVTDELIYVEESV